MQSRAPVPCWRRPAGTHARSSHPPGTYLCCLQESTATPRDQCPARLRPSPPALLPAGRFPSLPRSTTCLSTWRQRATSLRGAEGAREQSWRARCRSTGGLQEQGGARASTAGQPCQRHQPPRPTLARLPARASPALAQRCPYRLTHHAFPPSPLPFLTAASGCTPSTSETFRWSASSSTSDRCCPRQ